MNRTLHVLLAAMSWVCLAAATAEKGEEVALFNGKDLTGWTFTNDDAKNVWGAVSSVKVDPSDEKKLVGEGKEGVLLARPAETGGSIMTEKQFGDVEFAGEFLVPKDGNTGVFFMGMYEVQACDSFGVPKEKLTFLQCGGIPWTKPPSENASGRPGEWQKLEVVFRAPRFDASGKKTANATFVRVVLNGKTVQENVEVPEATGGGIEGEEKATGPILLQGDEGHGAWRKVRVRETKS